MFLRLEAVYEEEEVIPENEGWLTDFHEWTRKVEEIATKSRQELEEEGRTLFR